MSGERATGGAPRRPAGWYPDPDVSARFRWWNGTQWTPWLSATREQTFPPPGAVGVTPVPTRRDRVVRGAWIAVAAIAVAMAVMAGVGVVTNQRRAEARPDVPWPATVSPAATRTPLDEFHDLWTSPKGLITVDHRFSVQAPASQGWAFGHDGRPTSLSPFFDPVITRLHTSETTKKMDAEFFVGVPQQSLIPETIGQTAPATMRAFVQRTWGGEKNEPVNPTVRQSTAHPALGEGLGAWRITLDFVSKTNGADLVVDAVFFQNDANEWFVVVIAMGITIEDDLGPEFEAALASATLLTE